LAEIACFDYFMVFQKYVAMARSTAKAAQLGEAKLHLFNKRFIFLISIKFAVAKRL